MQIYDIQVPSKIFQNTSPHRFKNALERKHWLHVRLNHKGWYHGQQLVHNNGGACVWPFLERPCLLSPSHLDVFNLCFYVRPEPKCKENDCLWSQNQKAPVSLPSKGPILPNPSRIYVLTRTSDDAGWYSQEVEKEAKGCLFTMDLKTQVRKNNWNDTYLCWN